jgi:hypothetical protein
MNHAIGKNVTLLRRLRRARQRGAIMVEGLITLSLLVILLACAGYLFQAYGRKLQTFNEATGKAFRTATAGCGAGYGTYKIETLLTTPKPDPLAAVPDTTFLGGDVDRTNESASRNVTRPPIMGGGVLSIDTTAKVACNEPPMTKAQALAALGVVDWSVNGVIGVTGF